MFQKTLVFAALALTIGLTKTTLAATIFEQGMNDINGASVSDKNYFGHPEGDRVADSLELLQSMTVTKVAWYGRYVDQVENDNFSIETWRGGERFENPGTLLSATVQRTRVTDFSNFHGIRRIGPDFNFFYYVATLSAAYTFNPGEVISIFNNTDDGRWSWAYDSRTRGVNSITNGNFVSTGDGRMTRSDSNLDGVFEITNRNRIHTFNMSLALIDDRPVSTVPLPPAFLLLLTGVIGLGLLAKRRQK